MKYYLKRDKAFILAVLFIGLIISSSLQHRLLKSAHDEERYQFESQVSNITLFLLDDLSALLGDFELAVNTAPQILPQREDVTQDSVLASILNHQTPPLFSAIYRKPVNPANPDSPFNVLLLTANDASFNQYIHLKTLQLLDQLSHPEKRSSFNGFMTDLPLIGSVFCLAKEIPTQSSNQFLLSCYDLISLFTPTLERLSLDTLDIRLYTGKTYNNYKQVFSFSVADHHHEITPSNIHQDHSIFLPHITDVAGYSISILFTFTDTVIGIQWLLYLPFVFGLSLTFGICIYLFGLNKKKRAVEYSVTQKTAELMQAKQALEQEIVSKEALFMELKTSAANLESLTNSVNGVIWEADPTTLKYTYISEQVERILGFPPADYLNGKFTLGGLRIPNGDKTILHKMLKKFAGPDGFTLEYQGYRKDDQLVWIRNIITKVIENNNLTKVRGVFFDITEEKNTEAQRASMANQLKQAQKLEAIGQLAMGVAHEISTPSELIGDNMQYLSQSIQDLFLYITSIEKMILSRNEAQDHAEITAAISTLKERQEIETLRKKMPVTLTQSLGEIRRICEIVSAMKEFSHLSLNNKQKIDLNRTIKSTLIVAEKIWKEVADLHFDLTPQLPLVSCFASDVNQTILSILANAVQAIEEKTHRKTKGNITISTKLIGNVVSIIISDDGVGMTDDVRKKIFNPLFTTKERGKRKGLGLSIAYSVIVDQHDGILAVESDIGKGSTFTLSLPVKDINESNSLYK